MHSLGYTVYQTSCFSRFAANQNVAARFYPSLVDITYPVEVVF